MWLNLSLSAISVSISVDRVSAVPQSRSQISFALSVADQELSYIFMPLSPALIISNLRSQNLDEHHYRLPPSASAALDADL